MKFSNSGFLGIGKRNKRRSKPSKATLRSRIGTLEKLERREMMAVDIATSLSVRGFFTNAAGRDATVQYLAAKSTGSASNTSSSSSGEYDGTSVTVTEIEPNNGFVNAQALNFGNRSTILVNGTSTSALDDEYFTFDLNAGDIVDIRLIRTNGVTTNVPFLTLYDASRRELVTSQWAPGLNRTLPESSPLTGGGTTAGVGDIVLHYIVPSAQRYILRVSDVASAINNSPTAPLPTNYTLNIRRFRPPIESTTAGTQQILYLDFEGGFINRNIFGLGVAGSARMSATREFLQQYGLEARDEASLIDAVTRVVQSKFDVLASNTTNPNFSIDIRNSKDHPGIWGLPNVSRVMVGGTFQQLVSDPAAPSGILGIAQSIDPGNFDREESAIVMHDVFIQTFNTVPISATQPRINVLAELMGWVIAHEAGHFLGGWHQDPTNTTLGIMDQFYNPLVTSGAGQDGIYGTVDDRPIHFIADRFSAGGGVFESGGVNDTINWLGWALSTGSVGGRVQGTVFNDNNLNGTLDAGDARLSDVVVFADLDGDGVLDAGEHSVKTSTDGTYSLTVPAGRTYTIRSVLPANFKATAPVGNAHSVNVPNTTSVITGRNFGYQPIQANITGRKWNDSNGNGLRDENEPAIGGVWIYYDLDGDGRLDIGEPSVKTKTDGTYTLPNIGAGTYTIREVVEPGWVQTLPGASSNFGYTVTLTGNPITDTATLVGLDFANQLLVDYGDAPGGGTFPINYASASASFMAGLSLGTLWDAESAAQFSASADGDDSNGIDDEDGVVQLLPLVRGSTTNSLQVTTTNTTGQTAYLSAWMDFNRNGVFEAAEKIDPAQFTIPATTALGPVFTRFRYGLQKDVLPTGFSSAGEVEDYQFSIVATSNIAVDDTDTVPRNGTKIIDVLANDFRLPGGTLRVITTSGTTTAGGSAAPTANGAAVFYTAPQNFVGRDSFQYAVENEAGATFTATVVIDVSLFFANPAAIDDSFDVPTNAIDFPLNVLANDIEGQDGALSIVSVAGPDKGGRLTIAPGNKSLRYEPARGFGGTEFATYVVEDAAGNRSTARITLHTIPGDRTDDEVQIRLEAVDAVTGRAITQVEQGKEFKVRIYVDDLRFDTANPGVAAGVFSAYADLLYNYQLVSTKVVSTPGARFNFAVSFLGDYTEFTTGDASIPGIINEFGATSSSQNMQRPNEVPFAEITFKANSPGIAVFQADPADNLLSETTLFDRPGAPQAIEKIRYLGTQIQIFGDGTQFPVAIDDTAKPFAVNSTNEIRVLDNDLPGSTGSIRLLSVTNGANGFTTIDTKGTASLADDVVRYSPRLNFSGSDQFTYTIQDSNGIQATATVTVYVGVANSNLPDGNDRVSLELVTTDLSGTPITEITKGQQFQLRGFVKDLLETSPSALGDTRGVFSVYQDVLYNGTLVSPVVSTTNDPNLGFVVSFGPLYNRAREGDILLPGLINEIGAVATFDVPGTSPQNPQGYLDRRILMFTITMTANELGTATFFSDPADLDLLHEGVLTFDPAEELDRDRVHFGFTELNIVAGGGNVAPEFHNRSNPVDVNADGRVTALDALLIINMLNNGQGGRLVSASSEGEGESAKRNFPDTNNDGKLTATDALLVINRLNQRSLGSGEGEGDGEVAAAPLAVSSGASNSASSSIVSAGSLEHKPAPSVNGPEVHDSQSCSSGFVDWLSDDQDDDLGSVIDDLAADIGPKWYQGIK